MRRPIGLCAWLLACTASCKNNLETVPAPAPMERPISSGNAPQPPVVAPAAAPLADIAFVGKGPGGEPLRIKAEVVASEGTIQRGLMHRTFMPPDQGMLFLMGFEGIHSFWMRNTLIPLDMIFIGKDKVVVGVVANAEPKTDTSRSVEKPSLYVLEMNGGWAAKHNVSAGTVVQFADVETLAK